MPFTDLILAVVAAAWQHSLLIAPILILISTVSVLVQDRTDWMRTADQLNAYTVTYGVPIIIGITAGSTATLLTTSDLVLLTAAIGAGISILVTYDRRGTPAPHPAHRFLQPVWLVIPLIAAGGLLLDHVLLQHLATIYAYGIVFWDV